MFKNGIAVRTKDTILSEIERLNHVIGERAYELFRNNRSGISSAVADWLTAERQLVWKPAVELRRKDGEYEVLAATAGVPAKDLEVQISPEDLLIKAPVHHQHASSEGDVQLCEFKSGELFRSIHFPEKVDPRQVHAEYKDGLLRIRVSVAKKQTPTKIAVTSA